METTSAFLYTSEEYLETIMHVRESMQQEREDGKVMKAPQSHHETALGAHAKKEDASEILGATPGEKQNGDSVTDVASGNTLRPGRVLI